MILQGAELPCGGSFTNGATLSNSDIHTCCASSQRSQISYFFPETYSHVMSRDMVIHHPSFLYTHSRDRVVTAWMTEPLQGWISLQKGWGPALLFRHIFSYKIKVKLLPSIKVKQLKKLDGVGPVDNRPSTD